VLPFSKFKIITWLTVGRQNPQYGNTGFLINPMNLINPINLKSYKRRFIFFLIYANITIKLQNERHYPMSVELRDKLRELRDRLELLRGYFDAEGKRKRIDEIGKMMTEPNFWKGVRLRRGF